VTQPDELARLRRQLRAMASLNEQLRAQLDALPAGASAASAVRGVDPLQDPATAVPVEAATRRARRAQAWVAPQARDDHDGGGDTAYLIWRPDDGLFLIDAGLRRRVRSGLLAPVLGRLLGEAGSIDDETFSSWPEGPPVEVLEGPTGAPFVVVGGRRLPVSGLPLPHPVSAEAFAALAQGPRLDLIDAISARRAGESTGWSDQLAPAGPAPAPTGARAQLVVGDEGIFVVERDQRRRVTSGLLVPALEQLLGGRRPEVDHELAGLAEGPPLAVLEAASGPPFVVIEGKRLPLRGLPLPHPVLSPSYDRLVEGPELDLVRSATARRASEAVGWLADSSRAAGTTPTLVVDPDENAWLIEDTRRRRVSSPLLIAALEHLVGPRRRVEADQLAGWDEATPVEVLEGRTGPPFVVIGGIRHPVRALPVPFPVDETGATRLNEGPPLDVVRAIAARRHDRTVGWLDELTQGSSPAEPVLVTAPDSTTWVLEGSIRRQVRSGLLVPLLEALLGPRREATDDELDRPVGAVVEVLESRQGPPFLILGGIRHPLRAFPVPFPVPETGAAQLPQGAELDAALLSRRLNELTRRDAELQRRLAEREDNPDPVGELKAYLGKKRPR
jgi:hypothetical protein